MSGNPVWHDALPCGVPNAATAAFGRHLVPWCSLECTPACQAGGRGFKSRRDRTWVVIGPHGRVAQLVERAPEKREVTGSTPVPTTKFGTLGIHERALAELLDPVAHDPVVAPLQDRAGQAGAHTEEAAFDVQFPCEPRRGSGCG